MAQIVKKKKKRNHLDLGRFTIVFFTFSMLLYLVSALFLHSYNNSLSTKKQEIDSQIAVIQTQNDAVQVEIHTLSSVDRVYTIAANDGMTHDQSNITSISDDAADGE